MSFHHPLPGSASGLASSSSSGPHHLSSPFGDTTYRKVFVGGLAWETKSETLHRHFEQFGEILEAVVIADKKTGRWKGYGFVSIARLSASCGFFGNFSRSGTCKKSMCRPKPSYRWQTGKL